MEMYGVSIPERDEDGTAPLVSHPTTVDFGGAFGDPTGRLKLFRPEAQTCPDHPRRPRLTLMWCVPTPVGEGFPKEHPGRQSWSSALEHVRGWASSFAAFGDACGNAVMRRS